jgi:hypothetical protein
MKTNFFKFTTGLPIPLLLSCLLWLPASAHSQGFSADLGLRSAKEVGLRQLLPAKVNLNQKRIKVEAVSHVKTASEVVPILQIKLVTFIQKDPRFIIDAQRPQTLLKFDVTNAYIEQSHYTVAGPNKTTQACTAFTGKIEVSYQAYDTRSNAPLDSENLTVALTADTGKKEESMMKRAENSIHRAATGDCGSRGKPSLHEAQDFLVDGIVGKMAERAAPTETTITVKLPGKKLEPLSRLALAQRWGTLQEEAEKFAALPKPEDDAYRIYLIGLAEEAQAYDLAREAQAHDNGSRTDISDQQARADFQKAMDLLDKARADYRKAMQAKPTEKVFQEPDDRMEKAIAIYATIARHQKEYQGASNSVHENPAQPADSKTAVAGTPLDQIVKYCQSDMPMDTISEYINGSSFLSDVKATNYRFDIKNDPFTLKASCKDNAATIQKMMHNRLAVSRTGATKK